MKYRNDIEGLRAIAIVAVVLFHAELGVHGGYVGVDVFFTLSGYLITGLLVHEHSKSGSIDLLRFYARRIRRLLPASFLMVAVVTVITAAFAGPPEMSRLAQTAMAVVFYSSNLLFAYRSGDYLGAGLDNDPLLHTWSLGVEEQFYFLWPMMVWACLRFGLLRSMVVATLVVTLPLSIYATWADNPLAFFLSPLRAWEFALGAVGVVFAERLRWVRGAAWRAIGLGMIVLSCLFMTTSTPFPGVAAIVPTLGTLLALLAGSQGEQAPLLGSRPARELGRLSYSWYLWHWPFLVLGPVLIGRPLTVPETLVALVGSLAVAKASFHFYEQPLRLAESLLPNGRSFALGAVLMALGAGASGALWLRSEQLGSSGLLGKMAKAAEERPMTGDRARCHLSKKQTKLAVKPCTLGPPDAPRVVLFGDSHAQMWFPGLEVAANAGRIRLSVFTKSACAPIPYALHHPKLNRDYHECKTWVESVHAELAELQPDVVLLSARSRLEATEEQWTEGLRLLSEITQKAGSKLVFLQDVPKQTKPPVNTCAGRALVRGSDVEACGFSPVFEGSFPKVTRQLAASDPNVSVIDMNDRICTAPDRCRPVVDGLPVWRDWSHLSTMFTRAQSDELMRRLAPALP